MAWGGEFFSSDIMWWLGDWTRLILHQLPLARKSLKRGKDILVSTSWWEVANHIRYGIRFTVRILGGITHYLSLSLSLSPLNVPKTGFPWSIPPDLARLTPSDRYPELDNNNFSPYSGPFDPNSPKFSNKFPRRGGTLCSGVVLCVRSLAAMILCIPRLQMKLMVIPVGRSLVFSGSQAKILISRSRMAYCSTTSRCGSSRASCACGKSRACATPVTRPR